MDALRKSLDAVGTQKKKTAKVSTAATRARAHDRAGTKKRAKAS
jgi:hypothetical protein